MSETNPSNPQTPEQADAGNGPAGDGVGELEAAAVPSAPAAPAAAPAAGTQPAAAVPAKSQAAPKPAVAKAVAKPAAKAAAPAPEPATTVTRREFFPWLGAAWAVYTASFLATLGAMTRFMFPNVLFEPAATFKVGFPEEFSVGAVDERFKEKYGVWVVRNEKGIYVLSTTCTHLGCTPNWLSNEKKFKCPCHGSGFYITGINFEGPAPRPLERYRVVLADDGQILVDKTKKFQQEKGQWADPDSFLNLA
jgi:cytochrome b6-f complex iron-sulfur subunit